MLKLSYLYTLTGRLGGKKKPRGFSARLMPLLFAA